MGFFGDSEEWLDHEMPMVYDLYITNEMDYSPPEEGILRISNNQWRADNSRLEGYKFNDVYVNCRPEDDLRKWLHMHLGVRIKRIIYT